MGWTRWVSPCAKTASPVPAPSRIPHQGSGPDVGRPGALSLQSSLGECVSGLTVEHQSLLWTDSSHLPSLPDPWDSGRVAPLGPYSQSFTCPQRQRPALHFKAAPLSLLVLATYSSGQLIQLECGDPRLCVALRVEAS